METGGDVPDRCPRRAGWQDHGDTGAWVRQVVQVRIGTGGARGVGEDAVEQERWWNVSNIRGKTRRGYRLLKQGEVLRVTDEVYAATYPIPKGWRRVTRGKTRKGDRAWFNWSSHAQFDWCRELGVPVMEFSCVIRRIRRVGGTK